MTAFIDLTALPPENEEMRRHFDRLLWGPGLGASVLGRSTKTPKRWFDTRYDLPVEMADLAFVRRIVSFADMARALCYAPPPGSMTPESFRGCVYAFGWGVLINDSPRFSDVSGIAQHDVHWMATGRMPVSAALQEGFARLMKDLKQPRLLAAQEKARAFQDDAKEDAGDEA